MILILIERIDIKFCGYVLFEYAIIILSIRFLRSQLLQYFLIVNCTWIILLHVYIFHYFMLASICMKLLNRSINNFMQVIHAFQESTGFNL